MSRKFRIEMVFYTHPWSIHLLKDMGIINTDSNTVIIEVCNEPSLSIVCPDRNVKSNGTLPLLRRPIKSELAEMAKSYSLIPAPIILAPNPPTSESLLIDSLLVLDNKIDDTDVVILACHVSHAERFASVLPICDRFSIAWDTSDYPSDKLEKCVNTLVGSGCLDEEKWGGFHYGNHWLRSSDDSGKNEEIIHRSLATAGL